MAYYTEQETYTQANLLLAFYEHAIKTSNPVEAYPAYSTVAGNFDGAGISFGYYQWNFKYDTSLKALLTDMINTYPDQIKEAFDYDTDPTYYNTLVTVVTTYTTAQRIEWGNGITNWAGDPSGHTVSAPWKGYFNDLGAKPEMRTLQNAKMQEFFIQARTLFNTYTALSPATYGSQRFITLCLDHAVQTWSVDDIGQTVNHEAIVSAYAKINTQNKTEEEIELEKMRIFAEIGSRKAQQQYYLVVRARRDTGARGEGYVNGQYINLAKDFGITMEQAFPETSPINIPRLLGTNSTDSITNNINFNSTPKIRNEFMQTNRIEKLNTVVDEEWTFAKGINQESTYVVAQNTTGDIKYCRLGRFRSPNSYGRISLTGELLLSSATAKMAKIDVFIKDSPHGTIHADSKFNIINSSSLANTFVSGDIVYQQYTSGSYLLIDVFVKMEAYSKLSFNITGLVGEQGMTFELDPMEDDGGLLSALPATSSTMYWAVTKVGRDFTGPWLVGTALATVSFTVSSGSQTHNNLTGLQGGTSGEYYHTTSAQNTNIGKLISTGDGTQYLADDGNYKTVMTTATDETITGFYTFKNGVSMYGKKLNSSQNSSGLLKYVHMNRLFLPAGASWKRNYFKNDIIITGDSTVFGQFEGWVYCTNNNTTYVGDIGVEYSGYRYNWTALGNHVTAVKSIGADSSAIIDFYCPIPNNGNVYSITSASFADLNCLLLTNPNQSNIDLPAVSSTFDYNSVQYTVQSNNTVAIDRTFMYDDLPPTPILSAKAGVANAPTLTTFLGNIQQYSFAVDDYVYGSTEITHQYKEGTNLYPHVHIATNGLEGTTKYVKWELEYSIANPDGTFSTPVAINVEDDIPASTADRTQFILSFPTITGTGLKIGGFIVWRLKRITSTGTAPLANPFALSVGIHVLQDTMGSLGLMTK